MDPQFIHLRLHSEYSITDSLVRIKSLIKAAIEKQFPALALTDRMNLFATVKLFEACSSAGIKPIIGTEINLRNPEDSQKPFSLILLAKNAAGYRNIIELISKGYVSGQSHSIPQIDKQWLFDAREGVIVLSGAGEGDLGHAIKQNNLSQAENILEQYLQYFPQHFYLELQRTGREGEDECNQQTLQLAEKFSVPVVATNAVCFLTADDYEAHEARVCINQGNLLTDTKRPRKYSTQQYFKSPQQMQQLFADIPSAISNTVEIAKRCNVQLALNEVFLPKFPIPENYTLESYFAQLSHQGLTQRLLKLPTVDETVYRQRLDVELQVINTMGFAGYFLIVADFIQWAKDQGIPVGPGRGSGAGSLVAYALNITDLDPLKYDLLFERFLNPERVSMPDFDIDFCMDGRDRVIEYVANKYGHESVSQIITYGTMAAKAVVRDAGRVLGHGYGFVDQIAKLIPFELGITLDKALEQEEVLRERYRQEEEVQVLIDLAKKLEGITRNVGKHAGGVVIAPSKLTDFAPLYCEENGENLVTQFDKNDVETVGLVKFDFLGLRTLTIIDWAIKNIKLTAPEVDIDINHIDLTDEKVFQLLKECKTTAIFQLESRGMKDLIKRLQPDCFEDIVALVALFRPGPLQSGMVDDFIDRKHGRARVEYPHSDLEAILKPTYGVILYQEQVMQIAQVLAGYTLGAADMLRRAMGKKKPEEMAKQREIFVSGSTARGVSENTATHIFDLMEKFAGYGFNKSHSAAYALVSYQTAWLKTYYPAQYMAAVLSSDMDNTDKVVTFVDECRHMKIPIIPPDINHSHYKFTVNQQGEIIYGLGAIKGMGEAAINSMIAQRAEKPFQDLFSFCRRVDSQKVNKRVLEALVKSGAMDGFNQSRASLFASIAEAMKSSEQFSRNAELGQGDLFADVLSGGDDEDCAQYVEAKPWREDQRLLAEKETLGLYLSGHPINQYKSELSHIVSAQIGKLSSQHLDKAVTRIAGLLIAIRTMRSRRGDKIAFITLDDGTGRMEVALFSQAYEQYRDYLKSDSVLIVEGEMSVDKFTDGFRMSANRVYTLEKARSAFAQKLMLTIDDTIAKEKLSQLPMLLSSFQRGGTPLEFCYQVATGQGIIKPSAQWSLQVSDDLLLQLQEFLGKERVVLSYSGKEVLL